MGKGNRNSQKRTEENIRNSEVINAKQKKASQKKKSDRAVTIALAAFALLIVAVFALNLLSTNGVFIRTETAMNTANYKVDSAMMNFFYNNYLSSWYNTYSVYVQYGLLSLDPSSSLKTQQFKSSDATYLGSYDGTWYDYFLDKVSEEVEMYLTYAEGAKAAGITLTDEDYDEIDKVVGDIKSSLKEAKVSTSDWYGRGVKESDIRRAYELVYLAQNFAEYKQAELEKVIDDGDETALNKYVEDNKASFYTADLLKYTITTASKDFDNDAEFDLAVEAAVKEAEKILAAATPEEFAELVKKYEDANKADEADTEAETETETEDEEETVDTSKYETTVSYQVSDDLGKWLFEENAETGATKLIEATAEKTETIKGETKDDGTKTEDQEIEYDEHTVTVYLVTEPSHLDKTLTKDAGYFVSDNKEYVEAFLAQVKANNLTAEEFGDAAEKYAEEIHEGHDHDAEDFVEPVLMYDGIEKMQANYFPENYSALGNWIDSDGLENNSYSEIAEIKIDDETTYYGFVYFEKYNDETWYANAYSGTVNEQFEDWAETQKKDVTPITYNNKALSGSITPIAWSTGTSTDSHDGHDH